MGLVAALLVLIAVPIVCCGLGGLGFLGLGSYSVYNDAAKEVEKAEKQKPAEAKPNEPAPLPPPVDPPLKAGGITLGSYDAIRNGMTYDQVKDIIGRDGKQQGGGALIQVFEWSEGFKLITVTFEGGKVSSKAQIGL